MKVQAIIFCLISIFLFTAPAGAADEANAVDHDALRALRSKVEKAISSSDIPLLLSCLAKDFTLITADQAILTSEQELTTYWKSKFQSEDSIVTSMKSELAPAILTRFTAPGRGFNYGSSKDSYTMKNGRVVAINSVWTAQLVKESGEWKVESAHAGVNFIDNPVLEAKSMSFFQQLGVVFGGSLPGEVTK